MLINDVIRITLNSLVRYNAIQSEEEEEEEEEEERDKRELFSPRTILV